MVRSGGVEHYDTVLLHEHVPSLSLEVHYGLERASQRVTALDPEALWARRVPLDCAGTPAFGLAQADELVVLAARMPESPSMASCGSCGSPTWG